MSARSKLVAGGALLGVARAIANASSIITTIVLARLLTPDDFGIVAIAIAFYFIANSALDMQLSSALVHMQTPQRDDFDTAWTLGVLRGVALLAGLSLAGIPISIAYGDDRLLPLMVALGAFCFLESSASPKIANDVIGLDFRSQFYLDVASKLTSLVVSIGSALIEPSYWALMHGIVASAIVKLAASFVLAPYVPRFSLAKFKSIFGFSSWMTLSNILVAINGRIDTLAIGLFLSTTQVAHYSMGSRLASLPVKDTLAPLQRVVFPGFAAIQGDPDRVRTALRRAQSIVCLVAFPLGIGFALVASDLVALLLGPQWGEAVPVIQVLSVILAVQSLFGLIQGLAMGLGATRKIMEREAWSLAIRGPLLVGAAFYGGLMGVLAARAATGILGVVLNLQLAKRLVGEPMVAMLALAVRPTLACLAMAGCVLGMRMLFPEVLGPLERALVLAGQAGLGALVYCGVIAALWRLAGAPKGAETEALEITRNAIAGAVAKLKRRAKA
jgi:O-antigen/teichoic acid export membrane protein